MFSKEIGIPSEMIVTKPSIGRGLISGIMEKVG
jgi:hypothetical protein